MNKRLEEIIALDFSSHLHRSHFLIIFPCEDGVAGGSSRKASNEMVTDWNVH